MKNNKKLRKLYDNFFINNEMAREEKVIHTKIKDIANKKQMKIGYRKTFIDGNGTRTKILEKTKRSGKDKHFKKLMEADK